MVRILCIHGTGSNADIFESQTSALRSLLPSSWEWIFVEADIECGPLENLKGVYPGPYFTFFVVPTVARLKEVHNWLLNLIEEEGPFDGMMGFSAGGYVPLAIMLMRQKHYPFEPSLFRFMIFMSGNIPYSADDEEGIETTDWILRHRTVPADLKEIQRFNAWAARGPEEKPDPSDPIETNPALQPLVSRLAGSTFDRQSYYTRSLHPETVQTRLRLPTLHVLGQADDVYEGSKQMAELCDARSRQIYEHKGGHEMARDKTDLLRIKKMFEETVARSQQLA